MIEFKFQTLKFKENDRHIIGEFFKAFTFKINKKKLEGLGDYTVFDGTISFKKDSDRTQRRFENLISQGLENLHAKIDNKPTIYIHKNSGIPLIGNVSFGLVDRNTSCIEVKPSTGCNLKCTYCSVNDDPHRRPVDFIIDPEYLVDEFRKLAEFKEIPVEAHIQSQGEPLLYSELITLIKGLSQIPLCKSISIDTNGLLLTEKLVDELILAGLTRFNVSLDAMDPKKAEEIAGCKYNLKKVLKILKYISTKSNLIVAPVWVPKLNDDQIEDLIKFVKTLKNDKYLVNLCIQNFLSYSNGRNPAKPKGFPKFFAELKVLEKKYDIKLVMSKLDFDIVATKPTPVPFKRNNIIDAEIVSHGRLKDEKLAVARGRVIAVFNTDKFGPVKLKIRRSAHNIFIGEIA